MNKAMNFKYEQRCRLNMEACIFYEAIGWSKKFKVLILSAYIDDGSSENSEWMGFVQTIKHFIKGENTHTTDKVQGYINNFKHT